MTPITQLHEYVAKKKALLIAVGYAELHRRFPKADPPLRLYGTHRDPPVVARWLIDKFGFAEGDIVTLMDDGKHKQPTRGNIIEEMERLVKDSRPGDHFVFHYSGHGEQVENLDRTEIDGFDEVIWPMDINFDPETKKQDNYIMDDDLKKILVDSLPPDAHLTCVMDCCHSGTGLDLPFNHSDSSLDEKWPSPQVSPDSETFGDGGLGLHAYPKAVPERSMSIETVMAFPRSSTLPLETAETSKGVKGIKQNMKMPFRARGGAISCNTDDDTVLINEDIVVLEQTRSEIKNECLAHVTSWSACLDDQLGIDTISGGVLTSAFKSVLYDTTRNDRLTNRQMLEMLNEKLFSLGKQAKKCFKDNQWVLPQPKPCLGSLRPLDEILDEEFTF